MHLIHTSPTNPHPYLPGLRIQKALSWRKKKKKSMLRNKGQVFKVGCSTFPWNAEMCEHP